MSVPKRCQNLEDDQIYKIPDSRRCRYLEDGRSRRYQNLEDIKIYTMSESKRC